MRVDIGDRTDRLRSVIRNREGFFRYLREGTDLIPYWIFQEGGSCVERIVPIMPFSKEERQYEYLKKSLALYRLVFGQPRQEDLLSYLVESMSPEEVGRAAAEWRIDLAPPRVGTSQAVG